ncbi:exo-alpha-sialidase [Zhihengliuella salsuginis]|uniref:exo-alpha-sialidase n=1 Tax=Zhihengliuella salsuginis TaxID=578222 RepID=A0ABQ3GHE4_9MICC|nr:exo-alpha-sialidase [Zhihengliuella salsuginis]GHD04467.1 hypothetical protein GCM10008096_11830 [Zhihengliuella salsuginis]
MPADPGPGPAAVEEVVLASRGLGGYRQYRIPALARTGTGALLAVYDGRPTLDDLPSPCDLLMRRSDDGGRTWGAQQVLRTGTGLEGFGDASLIADPGSGSGSGSGSGRILCFHAATTRWGFFESEEGLDATQHVDVSVSDDDGRTWSHRRLTSQLKSPGIRSIFAASGTGTRIDAGPHRGRLLQACVVLLSTGRIAAAVARSDDHGDTWALGEPLRPSAAGAHTNESSVAALADGTVLLQSRCTPHRLAAVSHDGGASFSVPEPEAGLPDPSDNGSVLALDGGGLAATHNAHSHLRRRTAISHRATGGPWEEAVVLCPGASGYSTAVALDGGRLGVFYERGAYEELVFAAVPLGVVTAPAAPSEEPAARPVPGWPRLFAEVVPRSITSAPPARWSLVQEHAVLGRADGGYGPAGKEVGQVGAQVLASRADLLANYGPPEPGVQPGDTVTYSAAVRNRGPATVAVRPAGDLAGESRIVPPGGSAVWMHLNHVFPVPGPTSPAPGADGWPVPAPETLDIEWLVEPVPACRAPAQDAP